MNPFLFKTTYLATGQSLPFTGEWVNAVLGRNSLVVAYISGTTATVNLQGRSLLGDYGSIFTQGGAADNYNIFSVTGVTGYMAPAFSDHPITYVRLAVPTTGVGRVWAYINYQN